MSQHHAPRQSETVGATCSVTKLLHDIAVESGSAGVATAIVNLLESLEFEMEARTSRAADLRYVLTVHHRHAKAVWKLHRSFDEYEMLQQRLLRAMHHGHWCNANCPWLEGFLTGVFPHSTLLISDRASSLVEKRKKALLLAVQTLQKFITNRANHVCPHVVNEVAPVVLDFLYGNVIDNQHVLDQFLSPTLAVAHEPKKTSRRRTNSAPTMPAVSAGGSVAPPRASLVARTTGDLREMVVVEEADGCTLCGEALPAKDLYVMRLRCGHRFHDECGLVALNKELKCPTCGHQLAEIA